MNKQNDFFDKIGDFLKDFESIKNFIPPINKSGYPFIIIFIVFALILSIISDFLGFIGFVLTIWCIYFFRDPERIISKRNDILLSPADGKVLSVTSCKPPSNLSDDKNENMQKVSIFMNVFNVHVNRIPISGKVVWLKYIPGTFFNASLDKSSEDNERMISKIEIKKGVNIYLVQIAGLIARRIKCDLEENQNVNIGDRFGIIRFGSRVDLYFPTNFKVNVLEKQTTISGETVIAELPNSNKKIDK